MPIITPSPYINPEILRAASTGISWQEIPARNSTPAQQIAEQWNICRRATSMIDTEVNQRLRATVSTETLPCPDYRVTIIGSTGAALVILARKPILSVLSGQIAALSPPLVYQPIPGNAFVINQPAPGVYDSSVPGDAAESGQTLTLAAGYVTAWAGRRGQMLQVTYISGYPHCTLTADSPAGSDALTVDDTTGWAPPAGTAAGASGMAYSSGNEEVVRCQATSAVRGPGTLILDAPTGLAHQAGTIISALPSQVMQAAILFAVSQALVRGATATQIGSISGGTSHGDNPAWFAGEAELLCKPYRRTT
jgi:hypothetical protein